MKTSSNDPIISSSGERSLLPWCDLKAICVEPFIEKYLKLEIPWKLIKKKPSYEILDTLHLSHVCSTSQEKIIGVCPILLFPLEARSQSIEF